MVNQSDLHMDEIILKVFEEKEEKFFWPLTTQNEARAFVKELHIQGVQYDVVCQEIEEFDHNFVQWRKGLGRPGIGKRIMDRINRPVMEVLLSEEESSDDEDSTDGRVQYPTQLRVPKAGVNGAGAPKKGGAQDRGDITIEVGAAKKSVQNGSGSTSSSARESPAHCEVSSATASPAHRVSASTTAGKTRSPAGSGTSPAHRASPVHDKPAHRASPVHDKPAHRASPVHDKPATASPAHRASPVHDKPTKEPSKESTPTQPCTPANNNSKPAAPNSNNPYKDILRKSRVERNGSGPGTPSSERSREGSADSTSSSGGGRGSGGRDRRSVLDQIAAFERKSEERESFRKSDSGTPGSGSRSSSARSSVELEPRPLSTAVDTPAQQSSDKSPEELKPEKKSPEDPETKSTSSTSSSSSDNLEPDNKPALPVVSALQKENAEISLASEEDITQSESSSSSSSSSDEAEEQEEKAQSEDITESEESDDLPDSDDGSEVTENYDSDLDPSSDLGTEMKLLGFKVAEQKSQLEDCAGHLYILCDSPEGSASQRVKVGASRWPKKRLQQARLFNVDMRLEGQFPVSHQRAALQEAQGKLAKYGLADYACWYSGKLTDIKDIVMDIAKKHAPDHSEC